MNEQIIAIIGGAVRGDGRRRATRQQGFSGPLHLFSDEAHLPYERPPLSKALMLLTITAASAGSAHQLVAGTQRSCIWA